ncbi:MAG: lysophospholipase [Deltaproteobacteria bacterium]
MLEHPALRTSFSVCLAALLLWACAPHFAAFEKAGSPQLAKSVFTSYDGTELPLRTWLPDGPPRAVFIALHGYNDYSNFIKNAAACFRDRDIGVYAYDQRGFGAAPDRGKWAGSKTMEKDLRTIIDLVRKRYPGVPLYLLGHSMGGAVIMAADRPDNPLPCDGVVLVAPAVWSRKTMPFYQRWMLWLGARTIPWVRLSGKDLHITASDNREMLRAQGRDPLVLKDSRIDALYGLANLMDAAFEAAGSFNEKALFLYGAKDEVIPAKPMADVFRKRLQATGSHPQRFLVYKNGYHMLLRDLQAKVVWEDILFWLNSPAGTFPSVREKLAREIRSEADIRALLHTGN